jgi:hypothetical protein
MVSWNLTPVSNIHFRTLVLLFCRSFIIINFKPHSGYGKRRSLGSGILYNIICAATGKEFSVNHFAELRPDGSSCFRQELNFYRHALFITCRSLLHQMIRLILTASIFTLFDKAISHFTAASENLQKVSTLFPCFNITPEQREANVKNKELCRQAIVYLQAAKEADDAGLKSLKKIAAKL